MPTVPYRYLIAYTYNNSTEWARIDIVSPAPFKTQADVDIVQNNLRQSTGLHDAFIVSFSLYSDSRRGW